MIITSVHGQSAMVSPSVFKSVCEIQRKLIVLVKFGMKLRFDKVRKLTCLEFWKYLKPGLKRISYKELWVLGILSNFLTFCMMVKGNRGNHLSMISYPRKILDLRRIKCRKCFCLFSESSLLIILIFLHGGIIWVWSPCYRKMVLFNYSTDFDMNDPSAVAPPGLSKIRIKRLMSIPPFTVDQIEQVSQIICHSLLP